MTFLDVFHEGGLEKAEADMEARRDALRNLIEQRRPSDVVLGGGNFEQEVEFDWMKISDPRASSTRELEVQATINYADGGFSMHILGRKADGAEEPLGFMLFFYSFQCEEQHQPSISVGRDNDCSWLSTNADLFMTIAESILAS